MIGVRFTKPVAPFGVGDTAMLPEGVAQTVVDNGEAELYEFPASPHACAAMNEAPSTKVMEPGQGDLHLEPRSPKPTYRTKGKPQ